MWNVLCAMLVSPWLPSYLLCPTRGGLRHPGQPWRACKRNKDLIFLMLIYNVVAETSSVSTIFAPLSSCGVRPRHPRPDHDMLCVVQGIEPLDRLRARDTIARRRT